jgi:hypothetical protein
MKCRGGHPPRQKKDPPLGSPRRDHRVPSWVMAANEKKPLVETLVAVENQTEMAVV